MTQSTIKPGQEYMDTTTQQTCLVVALDDLLGVGVIYQGDNAGITWLDPDELGELNNDQATL